MGLGLGLLVFYWIFSGYVFLGASISKEDGILMKLFLILFCFPIGGIVFPLMIGEKYFKDMVQ